MKKSVVLIFLSLLCTGLRAQTDSLALPPAVEAGQVDTLVRPSDIGSFITLFAKGKGSPVDTLDVGDDRLQIVLNDDYTWHLIKNVSALADDDLFKEDWNEHLVNPYKDSPLDSISYRTTICLVDSVSRFVCPHQGKVFSKFGIRHRRPHTGCDVPYPTGTPVYCAFDGRVRLAERHKGYGNLVIVRHENGLETFYGHLSRIDVIAGQWVHAGDLLGLGGSTGRSSGPGPEPFRPAPPAVPPQDAAAVRTCISRPASGATHSTLSGLWISSKECCARTFSCSSAATCLRTTSMCPSRLMRKRRFI